jgi:hypothetical protein
MSVHLDASCLAAVAAVALGGGLAFATPSYAADETYSCPTFVNL